MEKEINSIQSNPEKIPPDQPDAAKSSGKLRYLLLALILTGAALRLYHIDQKGFWLDEMLTLLRITAGFTGESTPKGVPLMPPARLDAGVTTIPLSQVWSANPWALSPPLYYFLLKGWIALVGGSDAAIRGLSALLSVLTIPVGFLVGRQIGGPRAGLIMAALLATSPINIYYAQENRNYALLILTVLLSYYSLLRFRHKADRVGQVGYALAMAAALHTHYFACWILAAQALYVLWQRDQKFAVRWVTVALVAAILFLPWIPRAWVERTYAVKQAWLYHKHPPGIWTVKAITLPFALVFSSEFFLTYRVSLLLIRRIFTLVAGFILCGIVVCRKFPAAAPLLGGWIFVPLIALLAQDLVTGTNFLTFTRYAVMINPGVYLLLTLFVMAWRKRWSWIVLCFLLALNFHILHRYYKQSFKVSEWKEAAGYIQTKIGRGDLILIYNPPGGYDWVLPSSMAMLARYLPFQQYPFLLMEASERPQARAQPWTRLALLSAYSDTQPAWVADRYTIQDQATFTVTGTVWILQKRAEAR